MQRSGPLESAIVRQVFLRSGAAGSGAIVRRVFLLE